MSDVIQGVGTSGDFVRDNQAMASDAGFSAVSRIWFDQTQPISAGIDSILDEQRKRRDIMATVNEMNFRIDGNGDVVLEYSDGTEYVPTEHAWKQMATWMHVPHGFLNAYNSDKIKPNGKTLFTRDQRDKEVFIDVFENGKRRIEKDKRFRFRTYTDGTLRAMLSELYLPIDNVWYLETVAELFKEVGGDEPRLSHWRGDADTIYGNILIPDTCRAEDDSDYGGMFSVSNCEIGKRRWQQLPSVFRAICMNGCIWDQTFGKALDRVHRGKTVDLGKLRRELAENINSQIPLLAQGVERFLAKKDMVIGSVPLRNVFAELAGKFKLSYGQKAQASQVVAEFVEHEADNKNLFGIINAVTRAGQKQTNAEWVRFDEIGGTLMAYKEKQWDGFLARANNLDSKEVDKVFGVVAV